MWHMPGHILSRLKRYHDAAWQQEASARVDHAHMMRDRVMPDRIHNLPTTTNGSLAISVTPAVERAWPWPKT